MYVQTAEPNATETQPKYGESHMLDVKMQSCYHMMPFFLHDNRTYGFKNICIGAYWVNMVAY